MKCPYCSQEMEKGLIESSEPLNFMKEIRMINRPQEDKGEFNIAKPQFGRHCHIDVWLCRDCRKIIAEY